MPQGRTPYEQYAGNRQEEYERRNAVVTAQVEKEKPKTAIALEYDPADAAPKILATGKGVLAEKIIDAAKENHVPVHKDERLANTLSHLEVGDFIPPELYEVVAEVLVFVDRLDHIKEKGLKS